MVTTGPCVVVRSQYGKEARGPRGLFQGQDCRRLDTHTKGKYLRTAVKNVSVNRAVERKQKTV